MKYPSNCVYRHKSGTEATVNTAVDGILKVLKHKNGTAVIEIKVRRREALYMYINQILTGVEANLPKFMAYISEPIPVISAALERCCVDMTDWYKANNKDKQTIGYYKISISIEDLVP